MLYPDVICIVPYTESKSIIAEYESHIVPTVNFIYRITYILVMMIMMMMMMMM